MFCFGSLTGVDIPGAIFRALELPSTAAISFF